MSDTTADGPVASAVAATVFVFVSSVVPLNALTQMVYCVLFDNPGISEPNVLAIPAANDTVAAGVE